MPNFASLYYSLFNAITDACEQLRAGQVVQALGTLENAQIKAEDAYVESAGEK